MKKFMEANALWAKEKEADYFKNLSKGQSPSIFWIGCCDSRVIPTEISGHSLGDIFVQTNIANQINPRDPNAMSSLEYAINVLRVPHIVVCGHTHCGGINAAISEGEESLPPNVVAWIKPIREQYEKHKEELSQLSDSQRAEAMSCLNVKKQIQTLKELDLVQKAPGKPTIHGLLFRLETGALEVVDP